MCVICSEAVYFNPLSKNVRNLDIFKDTEIKGWKVNSKHVRSPNPMIKRYLYP